MALIINTNIVNDELGGYLVETNKVKAGENAGEAVMLDTVLETKDDKMEVWSLWPGGNLFRKNGMYSLGMVTGDKSISFEDGTGAEDMIYIAFLAGEDMTITTSGSNHIGLSGLTELESGKFAELIGIWNPALEKWVFTWRSMEA